ncbi:MAG: Succinate-semialdehyde dehydrogenase [NADP(+)] [Chlamydiia bacterium]|nr:Succinate-semialdehyde dehydrogenase [NADP(+)] [Chlamydiia bacterium]MCH9616227.1 Succinate-semialdehyde dehydrogenase [NADP(+)] [Chlamydiia bacterium]MCH9629787.1 Succinate-semialdehyde dehydrogenase [NADP(+)] [Chlamydiia bacterium]
MDTAYERSQILSNIAKALREEKEKLGKIITEEMGKPITSAIGEIDYTASYFEWFAGEAIRIYGLLIPPANPSKRFEMRYEPIGPVAVISPWNFPIAMPGRNMAAGFAAGCPMHIKPDPLTPKSMEAFKTLCHKAGLPEDFLHVYIGDEEEIGKKLLNDPAIKKFAFTGSTDVGKYLYKECAATLKKVTLELGGHAPLIVFADADIDNAVEESFNAKFRQNGQTCICANRLYVHETIHDEFVEKLIKRTKAAKLGDPLKSENELSNRMHPSGEKKALEHVKDALAKGATPHLLAKEGYEPEILTGVTSDMQIIHEETFGPVAPIISFTDIDAVLAEANNTPYGLAAYIFTENLHLAEKAIQTLEFGVIGLNDGGPSSAELPFGGVKQSGFGREGGPTGIYEYLRIKAISSKL